MSYRVLLSRQAERFYKKLQGNVRGRVKKALIGLESEPYVGKRLHGGLQGSYSLRVGKIRIVYNISEKDKKVYVIAIGPRKTIYERRT